MQVVNVEAAGVPDKNQNQSGLLLAKLAGLLSKTSCFVDRGSLCGGCGAVERPASVVS